MTIIPLASRFARIEEHELDGDDQAAPRVTITVKAGEIHIMATQGEKALIEGEAPFYVRGGAIMKPVVDKLPSSSGATVNVASLVPVNESAITDHLSRSADWEKFDGRKNRMVMTDPPAQVAATILSRHSEWTFPRLAGVITTPTLRPDGTILAEPGYDAKTQLLLLRPPVLPPIPEAPTKAEAAAALAKLDGLLNDFPFTDAVSRTVALSALITPVVRGAMPVVPMHAITATTAGSGKSYIVDLASAISGGERAPVISIGAKGEETEKRLHAAVLEGHPMIAVDNVNGELGGDFLCQMIERPVVAIRPLGSSTMKKVESRACCYATGNNIQLVGDMTRRVLLCSLDPNMERPELRQFGGNPFEAVLADRPAFIAAALVIVRAYASAGYPDTLPSLASFEAWSRLVRSALVWLGQPDPALSMEKARDEDPVTIALTSLLTAWRPIFHDEAKTVGQIIADAELTETYGNPLRSEFRQALSEIAPEKQGKFSSAAIGRYLGRHAGRVVAGLKLVAVRDNHTKQNRWQVQHVE